MHRQAVSVQFVERYRYFDQHLDACGERLSCGVLEVGAEQAEHIGPDDAPRLGQQGVASLVFLDKLHVAVAAVAVDVYVAQFGLYPILVRQAVFYGLPDQTVEFVKREGGLHVSFPRYWLPLASW